MSKEQIYPIEELVTDRINTRNLDLPPYLRGEIGVDVEKATRLMNLGGIDHVLLRSKSDNSRPEPQIVGFDEQGTAYSGLVETKQQSLSDTEVNDSPSLSKSYIWRSVQIAIDAQAISEQIMRQEREIKSSREWAKYLNKEIRSGIMKEGVSVSLKPSKYPWDYLSDYVVGLQGAFFIENTLTQDEGWAAFNMSIILLQQFRKGIEFSDPHARNDLLYSTHVGRALLTKLRGHTVYRNLIVPMESS